MKDPNTEHPFELNYEVIVRFLPAGRDPVELVFKGENTHALHPDHVRQFHGDFAETFDHTVRSHTLIAMASLLTRVAREYEAEAARKAPPPAAGKPKPNAAQFGELDLAETLALTPDPPEPPMLSEQELVA